MPPILAALGRIMGSLEGAVTALQSVAGVMSQIVELGLYGAGGVTLKIAENIFSKIENAPFFKKFNVDFGSKYMTPFGTVLYWNEIQKQILTANRQLGIAGQLSKSIENNIISAGASSLQFGFAEKEIVENYKDFIDNYGRNAIFTDDDLQRITKVSFALGQSYNGIFALTRLYGQSVEETYDFLDVLNKRVDRFGLNSKKVFSDIQNNIRLIDKYNFKNGVKGLSDMVLQANRLGMKMEDIAGFADKVYNPEDAIDAAASLQMLGGEFAKLGDPFSLLYDANNDLAGLTDKLKEITRGMGALNKETGMIDLSSLEMRQLREFGKITGQSLQDLAQQAKLMKKENLIGQALSPDLKQFKGIEAEITKLAGMADFTGGVPRIVIDNQQKLVSDLTKEDIDKLSQISVTPDGDSFGGLIVANQVVGDQMKILGDRITRAMNSTDALTMETKILRDIMSKGNESLESGLIKKTADVVNASKLGAAQSLDRVLSPSLQGDMSTAFSNWFENLNLKSDVNQKVLDSVYQLLGPDSNAAHILDGFATLQSGFHGAIGTFGGAVGSFGGWVKRLFKHDVNQPDVTNYTETAPLNSGIAPQSSFSSDLTTQNSFISQDSTLNLFKQNEDARQEMEKKLLSVSGSALEIKSANSTHKIEFSWNGKVYNIYDLFDDPKFKDMLKKDMGEQTANALLAHYSNGGKNVAPR